MMDADPQTFRAYDLGLWSEFALPGANGAEAGSTVDIRIAASSLQEPQTSGMYRFHDGRIVGSSDGIAAFSCGVGRIDVDAAVTADHASVGKLIIASALPATLWMRGEIVLHAAVAVLGGSPRAVAISGGSGAGKSTVLGQLMSRGARLVADDTARVAPLANDWHASGLPGGYFARAVVDDLLRNRAFIAVTPECRAQTAPLSVLLALARGTPSEAAHFQELHGADAFAALLRARHRPMVPRLIGTETRHLEGFAALSNAIRVVRWVRPEGGVAVSEDEYKLLLDMCA